LNRAQPQGRSIDNQEANQRTPNKQTGVVQQCSVQLVNGMLQFDVEFTLKARLRAILTSVSVNRIKVQTK